MFFQKLLNLFRKQNAPVGSAATPERYGNPTCEHGATNHEFTATVLGVECKFDDSPMCPVCTEQYLNKNSTLCASCKRPIFPGDPVGQAWVNAPHPYTHLTFQCSETGALYCGRWSEGRLVTLHELNPEKYPPGTSSILGHTFNTGSVTTENVN